MSGPSQGWGLSQHARLAPALDPAAHRLDARSPAQLMAFASGYARLLNYFDDNGVASADWSTFWRSDLTFLLAEVASAPLVQHDVPLGNVAQACAQALDINGWYLAAWDYDARHLSLPTNPLHLTLNTLITKELAPALALLLRQPDLAGSAATADWAAIWHTADTADDGAPADASAIVLACATFQRAMLRLSALAQDYLEQALRQPDHPPHTALYLAYLRLIGVLQHDMNGFVGRHLDFYLHDLLRQRPRAAVPDTCTLVFGLAPTRASFLLPAGSTASAGQDANGKPILYALEQATQLNQASIAAVCAVRCLHAASAGAPVSAIYATPVANSQDGLGAPLADAAQGWPMFGQVAPTLQAALGFMLASPALLLSEGRRVLRLHVSLDASAGAVLDAWQSACGTLPATPRRMQALPGDAWLAYVSGAKGWSQLASVSLWRLRGSNALVLKCVLAPGDAAIVPNAALAPASAAGVPLFKVLLNPGAACYAYSYLQDLRITGLALNVKVCGLTTLQLSNGGGPIAAGKPFAPFGATPLPGASWSLSHGEFAVKALTWVAIGLDWLNLPLAQAPVVPAKSTGSTPPYGFGQYYAAYQPYVFSNTIFTADLAVYNNGAWVALPGSDAGTLPAGSRLLFASDGSNGDGNLLSLVFWSSRLSGALPGAPASATAPQPGALCLSLTAPSYGFGQVQYPQLFALQAIRNIAAIEASMKPPSRCARLRAWLKRLFGKRGASPAAAASGTAAASSTPVLVTLSAPFVPQAGAVSVAYHAEDRAPQLYHVHPFGTALAPSSPPGLFPPVSGDGALQIGLAGVKAGQVLSMHIELRAAPAGAVTLCTGTAGVPRTPVAWSYLAGDGWLPFAPASVSSRTDELACSGIVTLQLPAVIDSGGTTMQAAASTFWIRASVAGDAGAYCNVVALLPQAALASRVLDNGVDGVTALAAGTIGLMSPAIGAIKSVSQPFASAGGRAAETAALFHARVSERLKHKQRASQPRDYEQLALDAWPGLWQAKCIGANNSRQFAPWCCPPGEVMLVVLPPVQAQPQLTAPLFAPQLAAIGAGLQTLNSPLVRALCVRNAAFEILTVSVSVAYQPGADASQCSVQLSQAINAFLSPWQRQSAPQLDVGCGVVSMAALLAAIRAQQYVAQASGFQVTQQFQSGPAHTLLLDDSALARPRAPWSVLVPAVQHLIKVAAAVPAPPAQPAPAAPPADAPPPAVYWFALPAGEQEAP